jgi:hypothetical protein
MLIRIFRTVRLFMLLSLPGCSGILLSHAQTPESLSPAQIKAYNDVGLDLYLCFNLGGPPPVGATAFFLWPKSKDFAPVFGPNCQIQR